MNSESQPSDKLKSILSRARDETPTASRTAGDASEASPKDLVDRNADLPDPRALARLYQTADLQQNLPDDSEEEAAMSAKRGHTWEELPPPVPRGGAATTAPASDPARAGDPGYEADAMIRPSMTPAEMRAVMADLQERFQVSDRSYETYEPSSNPMDDIPMSSAKDRAAEREAAIATVEEATSGGTWLFLMGGALVLLVVVVFIVLALNGPLKPVPVPTPSASPPAASPSV